MNVNLLSANGTAHRIAVEAFAQEARKACQPDNLVPLADQGSVRVQGDNSQQMIVDEAILHPYSDQPPGTSQVIRDCDLVLNGMKRWQGEDVGAMRQSVGTFCSKMSKLEMASVAGGLGLGAALYFAGLGWVGAGAAVATAAAGITYGERQKGQAREFEQKLEGWNQAIKTGNPHRLPIPAYGAVSFEYVFMVEKAHIRVSRSYRMPGSLVAQPPSWSGVAPKPGPERTLVAPENVASLDLKKPKRWGKFDDPVWPETQVVVPESIAQPVRMADQLEPQREAGPAVAESGQRVMVGGIAVRKKARPTA